MLVDLFDTYYYYLVTFILSGSHRVTIAKL